MTDSPDTATAGCAGAETTARLRRADVATGLVLGLVALFMILEALTYPLEGTYAGVRNAWYVSPALFPLIVGGALLVLSTGLVVVAARDHARFRPGRSLVTLPRSARPWGREAWFIAILLAAYIVGLVPRVDFLVSTALFLFVFMAGYTLAGGARLAVAACLVLPSLLALAVTWSGLWPLPRSSGQLAFDAAVAAVFPVAFVIALRLAEGDQKRRLKTAAVTSAVVAILLSALFRHGLLVPLPREGLGTVIMERAAGALSGLGG